MSSRVLRRISRLLLLSVSRLTAFSLKGRLFMVLAGLLAAVIIFSSVLLLEQYRVAISGTRIALRTHAESAETAVVRDAIESLERRVATKAPVSMKEIDAARDALRELQVTGGRSRGSAELLESMKLSFESFATTGAPRHLEDAAARLNAYIELSKTSTYKMVDALIQKQERTIKLALAFLIGFIVIVITAGYRMIAIITEPLSRLAAFVDSVDFEEEIPARVPSFTIPELNFVANSFDRLMSRLRGYRAVNVRRLIMEKRRADVIAASLSDGIILLKGDEILYLNPVAERILNIGPLPLFSGIHGGRLTLSSLMDQIARKGDGAPTAGNGGAAAVLDAVSRTMPVEFILESDENRHYYLIQAHAISLDVIEQVQSSVSANAAQVLETFQANTLVIAQDMSLVRKSQEAKGHFLATLSHEIKTPVTSLTMATRLLLKNIESLKPEQRSLVMTCVDDVERLRKLLDDLLTISNFDTLTQRLQVQNVDFARLFRHTVQTFQTVAAERGVVLRSDVEGDARVVVSVDPAKITWALSNLLNNAIRHTPRGGLVEALVGANEEHVEVRVRDSGPGIEAKRQSHIFDKFWSFYDIRVARSGGTGTGLPIAREIVVAHGGRIWVQSEPGSGAEFCFTIPRRPGKHRSSEAPAEIISHALSAAAAGTPETRAVPHPDPHYLKGASLGSIARS